MALADKIVEMGVLKKKSIVDCQHIAAAIIANILQRLLQKARVSMKNSVLIKNGLDLDDIRAMRTANANRYEKMTTSEIIEDINSGAKECLARMEAIRLAKKDAV